MSESTAFGGILKRREAVRNPAIAGSNILTPESLLNMQRQERPRFCEVMSERSLAEADLRQQGK
jgi:hypothetical protein